jgi:hypothetical protein
MARPSDFITQVRQEVTTLLETINHLDGLRLEWDGLDYGNTLELSDFEGTNSEVDTSEIAAAIGTTLDALNGLLNTGHRSNLLKVRM